MEYILIGALIVIVVSLYRILFTDYRKNQKEKSGVHFLIWVFWFIAFFPALIIVAIVHHGRRVRSAINKD